MRVPGLGRAEAWALLRARLLPRHPERWIAGAALGFGVLVTGVIRLLSDRWWPATVLAFGPRWVMLLPIAAAAVALVWLAPKLLWAPAAGALLVAGPAMGFSASMHRWFGGDGPRLRVLTYNADGGIEVARHFDALLERTHPDVAAFQECGSELAEALARVPGMETTRDRYRNLCVLSRFPILAVDSMDRSGLDAPLEAGIGGSGAAWRLTLRTPQGPLSFVVVHLETPRKGLERLETSGGTVLRANTEIRAIESRRARRFVNAGPSPRVVVGDFNLPAESAIWGASWGDLHDAWTDAGVGYGWTRNNGWIRVRIDHVLTDGAWRAVRASVGSEPWSDHWPLLVDLAWTKRE